LLQSLHLLLYPFSPLVADQVALIIKHVLLYKAFDLNAGLVQEVNVKPDCSLPKVQLSCRRA